MEEHAIDVPELRKLMIEAEERFQTAASNAAFVDACQSLKEASVRLAVSEAAFARAQAAYQAALPQPENEVLREEQINHLAEKLLKRARRVAQGLPGWEDLRCILFPASSPPVKPEEISLIKLTIAMAQATRERSIAAKELFDASDAFDRARHPVMQLAIDWVQSRHACQSADGTDREDTMADVHQEARAEMLKLHCVAGLEEFFQDACRRLPHDTGCDTHRCDIS